MPGPAQHWDCIPTVRSIKSLQKPASGDTTFFIRENIFASSVNLIEIAFYKKYVGSGMTVYVETNEYDNGHVTDADVQKVVNAMLFQTPIGSIHPELGILPNETAIFGQTPDIDQNGRLFILLIDIRDDYKEGVSETYVAGYFDPLDQINSGSGKGNRGDMIYIDTNPANAGENSTLNTVAHELQHLIHFRYDSNESTWLNEGFSELAPRLLGFPSRSFAHFLSDTDRPLNNFDDSITDYSKVALWSFYMYRRFGMEMIGEVTRDGTRRSLDSYLYYLHMHGYPSMTSEDLLTDWYLANLLNDSSIDDGRYGYGVEIPTVTSGYFSSNFTEGEIITENLHSGAAEYVQFYSGKDIQFNMTHSSDDQLHMAVVKHTVVPDIEIIDLNGTDFQYSDPDFGYGYEKISFIPFSTSLLAQDDPITFNFSADGIGGTTETEIAFDGDSTSFYIILNGAEAAERFVMPSAGGKLKGIKVHCDSESPITIRLYTSASSSYLAEWKNLTPYAESWTRFDFGDVEFPEDSTKFILSVSSSDAEQALGYSHTKDGTGRALLKESGGVFISLANYSVGSELLTGDWHIRAIVSEPLNLPPEISIEPDSLYLWQNDYSGSFTVRNGGTQALEWEIAADVPTWLTVEPDEGVVTTSCQSVDISIDRNILPTGINEFTIPIQSNGGSDTLFLSVLQRNYEKSQAVVIPAATDFSNQIGRLQMTLFNIGIGESEYKFTSQSPVLYFSPASGVVGKNDTVSVEVFLDREALSDRILPFGFFDGVDTLNMNLTYSGDLHTKLGKLTILSPMPNPFIISRNSQLAIPIRLPNDHPAELKIFDIRGYEIRAFPFSSSNVGLNVTYWDGKDHLGKCVSSGIYFLFLKQGTDMIRRKFIVLR